MIPILCQYPPTIRIPAATADGAPAPAVAEPVLYTRTPADAAMDVYTTSFTYPRRARQTPADTERQTDPFALPHASQGLADVSVADNAAIEKLAMMAMSLHGCHVSYMLADHGRGWNFLVTGAYQQVMITRGMILKDCPIQVRRLPPACAPLLTALRSIAQPSRSRGPRSSTRPRASRS